MDYTIGNHEEWLALYQTHDLEAALEQAARVCELVVCTHSGDPVKLIRGAERAEVPVERITPVDATGAGDQFAAGFLYGMATDRDLETAGRMGVAAASEVIRHIGPRPKRPLSALFCRAGPDLRTCGRPEQRTPHSRQPGFCPMSHRRAAMHGFGSVLPHSWRIAALTVC